MINWFRIIEFLKYKVREVNAKSLLNNELKEFYEFVVENESLFYAYESIENRRESLLEDETIIQVNDLGAGSIVFNSDSRKISDITRFSLKEPKFAQILFKIINFTKAETIIELGTSLGITTCYLATANSNSQVYTVEGCEKIAEKAQENFDRLGVLNIELVVGNIDNVLPDLVNKIDKIDVALIDGNHTEEATVNYFLQLLQKTHSNSVLVFDDIYWSKGMKKAWDFIKNHDKVSNYIDLFELGIVFVK